MTYDSGLLIRRSSNSALVPNSGASKRTRQFRKVLPERFLGPSPIPRLLQLRPPSTYFRALFGSRGKLIPYGGFGLVHGLVQALGLPAAIDRNVTLFRFPCPYHESDHFLTHAYNLFAGGTCIEDIGSLPASAAFRNLPGACRVSDPTTAGDFLRRFGAPSLGFLQRAFDDTHEKVWKALPRRKCRVATV